MLSAHSWLRSPMSYCNALSTVLLYGVYNTFAQQWWDLYCPSTAVLFIAAAAGRIWMKQLQYHFQKFDSKEANRTKLCNNCKSCHITLYWRSPMIVRIACLNFQKESTQKIHVGNGVDMTVYYGHDKHLWSKDTNTKYWQNTRAKYSCGKSICESYGCGMAK